MAYQGGTSAERKFSCNSDFTLAEFITKSVSRQISGPFEKHFLRSQRTPWGGGKRMGVENLTNDTPPEKGFGPPPRTVRFPPPSGVSALFFLYKNPRQGRPEALLEGSKNFREGAFSGTFSSPHTFCTPPYHGPKERIKISPNIFYCNSTGDYTKQIPM